MGKHTMSKTLNNGTPHEVAEQHVQERGTYQVGVTFKVKGDPFNADHMQVKFWPGTADGFTAPQTMAQALEDSERVISTTLRSYPAESIEVAEIRITTFEQGGPADSLVDAASLQDLADDLSLKAAATEGEERIALRYAQGRIMEILGLIGKGKDPHCVECGVSSTHVGKTTTTGERVNLCGECLSAGGVSGKYQED